MTSTKSLRNVGQCCRTVALSLSKLRPNANEESISRSVIHKSPLRVAALTSLLIACSTMDFAQSLTAFWHILFTLLDTNKSSICMMKPLLTKNISYCTLLVSSSPNSTYSVSFVNVSLLLERMLKHSLKTVLCLCCSSFCNCLVRASHSSSCCF
jgi:hypothetical protein